MSHLSLYSHKSQFGGDFKNSVKSECILRQTLKQILNFVISSLFYEPSLNCGPRFLDQ